jgi:hypothetical protein
MCYIRGIGIFFIAAVICYLQFTRYVQEQFQQLLSSPGRVLASPRPSPSAPSSYLAQQIDKEILELRNFFEDHREEMMSLLYDPQVQVPISYLWRGLKHYYRTGICLAEMGTDIEQNW